MKLNKLMAMRFLFGTFHSAPRLRLICCISGLAVLAVTGITAHAAPCNINMGANQQTMDGFGFSSAWCGTLSGAKNNSLYGTLGMSLLRIRIDENNNWTSEIANSAAAHAAGAKVLGCPWSAPSYMLWSTNIVSNGQTNTWKYMFTNYYGAFSLWLSNAAVAHNLDFVSVKNEPDLQPPPDFYLSGSDIHNFCANYATNIHRPVLMADAVNFNYNWSDPTLINDPVSCSNISFVSTHFYGGGNHTYPNAQSHGKRVWMTEHYVDGVKTSFPPCMTMAKEISDAMNNQFSAYIWWWVYEPDNSVNLVGNDGTIYPGGYMLGQFAKWIRPGSTRVAADYNPQSNVYVTAYTNGSSLVIVALNMGSSSVLQQFSITNGTAAPMLEAYRRTSSTENMGDTCGYATSAGSFTAPLPAQSVTTFVQTGGGPGTPASPTNLTATSVSGSQINLAWSNTATNATACLVERSSDNVYFTQIASLAAAATGYSDTSLPGSTTYYYRVRANNNGLRSYSNTANATTQPGVPAVPTGLTGVAGNGQTILTWNASGGTPATGYNIKRSTNSGGPYTTVVTSTATNIIDMPLTNLTAYYYVVSGTNDYGTSSNSTQVTLTPLPTALPAPWLDQDIGSVGQTGRGGFSNTVATVTGSGADIWGNADAFHYAYFLATNDCTIIARVTSVENTDPWAKAGVMIRSTLAAGSAQAMMVITPGNGASFQWRPTTGGTSSQSQSGGVSAPYWVKLVRTGNSFRGYVSADGGAWTQVGTAQTISMAGAVYVGLPVTAHNNTNLCMAMFDNVWSTAPLGPWQHQDIGSVGLAGSASNSTSLFTVTGAGGDIWGTADAFNYAFLPVTNNCTIVARVVSLQNIDVWSKAGVMIRASLDANAANAFVAVTPSNGVTWQYRSTTGGTSANATTGGLVAPYWVKLVRSGSAFTGYRSTDGTNWTQQGTATFAMASTTYIGLAVTSHNSASVCTATFDNVTATGWPLLPGAPSSLTATVGDAQVALSWAAASGASSYNVKSATNSGGSFTTFTNVTTTNCVNTGLLNGATYFYVVSALNISGESTNSVQAIATLAEVSPV